MEKEESSTTGGISVPQKWRHRASESSASTIRTTLSTATWTRNQIEGEEDEEGSSLTSSTTVSLLQKLEGLQSRWKSSSQNRHSAHSMRPHRRPIDNRSSSLHDIEPTPSHENDSHYYSTYSLYQDEETSVLSMGSGHGYRSPYRSAHRLHRSCRSDIHRTQIISSGHRIDSTEGDMVVGSNGDVRMTSRFNQSGRTTTVRSLTSRRMDSSLKFASLFTPAAVSARATPGNSASSSSSLITRDTVFDRLYLDALSKQDRPTQNEQHHHNYHYASPDRTRRIDRMESGGSCISSNYSFYSTQRAKESEDNGRIDCGSNLKKDVYDRLYKNRSRPKKNRHSVSPYNKQTSALERRLCYAETTPNIQSPHWRTPPHWRTRMMTSTALHANLPSDETLPSLADSVHERLYRNEPRSTPILKHRPPPACLYSTPPPRLSITTSSQGDRSSIFAAVLLQSNLRRTLERYRYLVSRHSIMVLQGAIRRFLLRQNSNDRPEEFSAFCPYVPSVLRLQRWTRKAIAVTTFQTARNGTVLLQALFLGRRSRRQKADFYVYRNASIKIQRLTRIHLIKTALYNSLHACALTIQRSVRGAVMLQVAYRASYERVNYRDRLQMFRQKLIQQTLEQQLIRKHFIWTSSATSIQALWRAALVRTRFALIGLAATIIGSNARAWQCRLRYLALRTRRATGAICIQAIWRGCQTRTLFTIRMVSFILFQALVRRRIQRQSFLKLQNTSLVIQRFRRDCMIRRLNEIQFRAYCRAAVLIQAKWRSVRTEGHFVYIRAVAVLIQSIERQRRHQRDYHSKKNACRVLQMWFRRAASTTVLHQSYVAASSIQSLWRGCIARSQWMHKRTTAILLQSFVRAYFQRAWYTEILRKVERIQAVWRSALWGGRILEMTCACIMIQCLFRRHLQVHLYKKHLSATLKIQTVIRRRLEFNRKVTERINERQNAVTLIQASIDQHKCAVTNVQRLAVRVIQRISKYALAVELCPDLQAERIRATKILQRFFTIIVCQNARRSRQRIETELIFLRSERAASKAVEQLLEENHDYDSDHSSASMDRLAKRTRAAQLYLHKTTEILYVRHGIAILPKQSTKSFFDKHR